MTPSPIWEAACGFGRLFFYIILIRLTVAGLRRVWTSIRNSER